METDLFDPNELQSRLQRTLCETLLGRGQEVTDSLASAYLSGKTLRRSASSTIGPCTSTRSRRTAKALHFAASPNGRLRQRCRMLVTQRIVAWTVCAQAG